MFKLLNTFYIFLLLPGFSPYKIASIMPIRLVSDYPLKSLALFLRRQAPPDFISAKFAPPVQALHPDSARPVIPD